MRRKELTNDDGYITDGITDLSDLFVTYLEQLGVEYIFGVPGGAIEPLYNALARSERRGGIRGVVSRHETGAAFMADGYTRETGKLGVCCATTGPGATNLITGVATAYADNTPMLVISAQTALPNFGRRALQESSCTAIDTVSMFRHCCVYNTLVSHPKQLEGKLIAAVMAAFRSPRGPAHLSIPRDVFSTPWQQTAPVSRLHDLIQEHALLDSNSLERLCSILEESKQMVLVVGHGCGNAIGAVMKFAVLTGAHVVTTPQGKTWVDVYHPLYRGVFGFAGHESARQILMDKKTDCILAIGTSLDEFATSGWDRMALLNEKLIHIDDIAENFSRSPMARMHLHGHIGTIFKRLVECTRIKGTHKPHQDGEETRAQGSIDIPSDRRNDDRTRCAPRQIALQDASKYRNDDGIITPQRLICELTCLFPPETRFLADAGNSFVWTTHYLHPRRPGNYRVGMGFGTMGWAIGASVGTALGNPDVPTICITGDGSYLMNGQEITVAVAERLCVVYVILNDQALGMVKHGQRLGGAEETGYQLPAVDFCAMAQAMGAQAFRIRTARDMAGLDIDAICRRKGPTLLDVYIDSEVVPPMGVRVSSLAQQTGKKQTGFNN